MIEKQHFPFLDLRQTWKFNRSFTIYQVFGSSYVVGASEEDERAFVGNKPALVETRYVFKYIILKEEEDQT